MRLFSITSGVTGKRGAQFLLRRQISSLNSVDEKVIDCQYHVMSKASVALCDRPGFITKSKKLTSEKVTVFSQFLEHTHVIEQQLMLASTKFSGMYSPMHSISKVKSLATFQNDSSY